jgi:ferritin-like metal-binding protein YciE
MGIFSSHEFNTLDDLLMNQLEDLYDAEQQILDALPKMEQAATHPQLRSAFREHLNQTQEHVSRLDQVFSMMNYQAERETCEAMKGIISEGEEAIDAEGDPAVKDAALIAAAQRVEHYEIASYGTARTLAQQMGRREVANLLQETLENEKQTDQKLTQIAESSVNVQAPQM